MDSQVFDFNDSDSDSSVAVEPAVDAVPRRATQHVASEPIAFPQANRRSKLDRAKASHPVYFPIKHFCERVFAGILLVVLAPLILALIVVVRLTSKGPGIYRQERVGLDQNLFDVYKLRTMYNDAEADGQAKWSQKGDPRITPIGRFLRRTHMDELPQLWNVVTGDMSLTGPRPERPSICEKLDRHIRDYYARNMVKPGITGLAQINLEPDCTINDVRRKQCLDLHYIETAGPWLDIRMVMATVLRMFGIRGSVVTRWMGLCRKGIIEQAGLCETDLAESKSIASLSESDEVQEFESLVAVEVAPRKSRPK